VGNAGVESILLLLLLVIIIIFLLMLALILLLPFQSNRGSKRKSRITIRNSITSTSTSKRRIY